MGEASECVGAFMKAACVPLDAALVPRTLDDAQAILASHPGLAGKSISAAAILGDDIAVRGWLEKDPGLATSKGFCADGMLSPTSASPAISDSTRSDRTPFRARVPHRTRYAARGVCRQWVHERSEEPA
jgi:hypothetical protein